MAVVRNYRYGSYEVVKYHDNHLCHPIISDALKSTVKLHDHIEYLPVLLRSSQWYSTVIPWQQKWPLASSPPFSKVSHTHQVSCLLLLTESLLIYPSFHRQGSSAKRVKPLCTFKSQVNGWGDCYENWTIPSEWYISHDPWCAPLLYHAEGARS